MNAALRLEFGVTRSALMDTAEDRPGDAVNPSPSPVEIVDDSNADEVLLRIESPSSHQLGTNMVDQTSLPDDIINNQRTSFAGFFSNISTLGKDKNSSTPPSIVAGLTCGLISLIPNVGQFVFSVMAQAVHEAYAGLASFIGSDGNQIARTVFSGVVVASAAIRTVFPMVKEALLSVQDPNIKFVLTVISFALAAGHLLISTVALVIATNNLPALISKNDEAIEFKSNVEKIKEAINYFFDNVEKKVGELNEKGLVGWLGVLREWLMTSAAVVGFLSALPLLLKTVGTIISAPVALIVGGSINLVAGIVELVQGFKEYRLLNRELKDLEAALKLDIENEKLLDSGEIVKRQVAIEEKRGALLASKIRIGKAVIGIVTSVASIVLGVLAIAASISVPFLPAVITAISVLTVVAYVSVTIALTEMRKQGALAAKLHIASMPDVQEIDEPENLVLGSSPRYS